MSGAGRAVVLGGLATVLAPAGALACSSCFWGDSNALAAYVGTAALLSLLPFALIGGIGWWFYRRTRAPRTRP